MNDYEYTTIRVVHVIGKMDRGGAETMIMNYYRSIDRRKIQFDFLVNSTEFGEYDDEIRHLGGCIYYIPKFTGKNYLSYNKACKEFFEKHNEISIVHGHIGSSASIYLKQAKKAGKICIAHSHNTLTYTNYRDYFYRLISYPTRYIADYFFGCSTEAGISRFGTSVVSSKKYSNVKNAIDCHIFRYDEFRRIATRNELKIPENAIVLGTIGRITEQKNPEKIFDIFKCAVELDERVVCIWVGKGDLQDKIEEKIIQNGLSSKIRLLGVRNDVPDLLSCIDCIVFPSFYEGLPVSIIEAQATGVYCLLSDTISKEVEVTKKIEWKSIKENSKEWAKTAFDLAQNNILVRHSAQNEIANAGYEIVSSSKWLMDFYLNAKGRGNNDG